MKTVRYGKYTIKSFPKHVAVTGQWTLNISIFWDERGAVTTRPFAAEVPYPTEEEADLHGITFGQRIIDGKVPGLLVI